MTRKFTIAAASVVATLAVGACGRADNAAYDSTSGATAGAMATPPAMGMSTGAAMGMSTGASTSALDSTRQTTKKP